MKLFHYVLLGALLVLTSACKPIEDLKNTKTTLLVDLDAVAQALGRDEVIKQEILAAEQQLRDQLGEIAGDLQKQVKEEQSKLDAKPRDEDKVRVEQLALQAQQTFRNQQLAAQQKANQVRAELLQKFRDEIKAVAEPIAREQDASVVKLISADVLWFDPSVDITGEVIAKMRAGSD